MSTSQMSREQQESRNSTTFRQKFVTLSQAGIGVVLVRTREPFRALETLRDQAFADEVEYQVWTMNKGWERHDRTKPADSEIKPDGTIDPVAALKKLEGDKVLDGIYAMMYLHKPINASSMVVQIIKEYTKTFAQCAKRLVLVVPPGFSLPMELEDDLVILDFEPPSYAERRDIYLGMVEGSLKPEKQMRYGNAEIDRILAAGAGMTGHEFENSVSRAIIEHKLKLPNIPINDFVDTVMATKIEVVKRSEVLEVMPTEGIEKVGGLENLKLWIKKRANCFSQEASDAGVEPPKGIALIGPPGTGKSLASKAIGSVLGLPLIKFDVSRVFQSLVGQSEERVRAALKMVDAMAPCVLMIDEVDKAFQTNSGGGDSGVGQRVLGAILTWMQETKAPVFMVVTANRTRNLPAEFLRRGRLDEIFSVTVPNETEREAIIKIHLAKRKQKTDFDLREAVEASNGYVSAEIEAAVKDAVIEAYTGNVAMSAALIREQLGYMKPLSAAFPEQFEEMREWAENNARPASLEAGQTTEQPAAGRTRSRSTSSRSRILAA